MYLERYRRTKVSNILRSIEGRNLPAVHADGSVVQIKAIITRSDQGNDGSMLFKGVIKRLDATIRSSTNTRKGYSENHWLEIKKDGTITNMDPSILTLLGYGSDKMISEYIGQSIDTLVPPMPDNPRQQRSFWIPQALASTDLNFYILFLNKSFNLYPFTYCLAMKSSDVITMRIRDLTSTDALVTIDEIGTLQSVNEDAYLLLGHEEDDVVGRNIKCIMAEDIAVQHDGFLLR